MQYVVTFKGMDGSNGRLPQQNALLSFPHEIDVLHVEQSKGRTSLPLYSTDITPILDATFCEMKCEPVDVVIARLSHDDYFHLYRQSDVPKEHAPETMRLIRDKVKKQFSSYLSNAQMADMLKDELYRKHRILISSAEADDGMATDCWLLPKREWDHDLDLVDPIEQGMRIGQMLRMHPSSKAAFERATHLLMVLASNGTWLETFQRVGAFAQQFDESHELQMKPFALYLSEAIGDYQLPEWVSGAIANMTSSDSSVENAHSPLSLLACKFNEECESGRFVRAFISFVDITLKNPINNREKLLAQMCENTL